MYSLHNKKVKKKCTKYGIKIAEVLAKCNNDVRRKQARSQKDKPPQKPIEVVFADKYIDLINQKRIVLSRIHSAMPAAANI